MKTYKYEELFDGTEIINAGGLRVQQPKPCLLTQVSKDIDRLELTLSKLMSPEAKKVVNKLYEKLRKQSDEMKLAKDGGKYVR